MAATSPVRGIEKIWEELKQERAKSSNALQDKARQKIEIEKLKQELSLLHNELEKATERAEHSEEVISSLHQRIDHLENANAAQQRDFDDLQDTTHTLEERLEKVTHDYHNTLEKNSTLQSTVKDLNNKLIEWETKYRNLDRTCNELKQDMERSRKEKEALRASTLDVSMRLSSQSNEIDELRHALHHAEAISSSYGDLQTTCDNIRLELEECVERNSTLSHDLQEALDALNNKMLTEKKLLSEIAGLQAERNSLNRELKDVSFQNAELIKRIEAETQASEIASRRAEAAVRTKAQLQEQIEELKEAHEKVLAECHSYAEEISTLQMSESSLKAELSKAQEKIFEQETALASAAVSQGLVSEVESLRTQLHDVRKKLLRRDMDDAAAVVDTEREMNSKKVYEGIIADLRLQLERSTSAHHEALQRLSDAMEQNNRYHQLEDELKMYKETAYMVTAESKSVSASMIEAQQRSDKASHELQTTLRYVQELELQTHQLQVENKRLAEDLSAEKDKFRALHLDKLAYERKISELNLRIARSDASVEDLKVELSASQLELDRTKRTYQTKFSTIDEMQERLDKIEKEKATLLERNRNLNQRLERYAAGDSSLEIEVSKLRQTKDTLQRELDAAEKTVKLHKASLQEAYSDMERLRREISDLKAEREFFRRDISLQESSRAELQIQELRKEISSSMMDWSKVQEETAAREAEIATLTSSWQREKEKVTLLTTQISLLEDRLNVAMQELAVFRSLDIHKTSMTLELSRYRSQHSQSILRQSSSATRSSPQVIEEGAKLQLSDLDTRGVPEPSEKSYMSDDDSIQDIFTTPASKSNAHIQRKRTDAPEVTGERSTQREKSATTSSLYRMNNSLRPSKNEFERARRMLSKSQDLRSSYL